MKGKYGSSTTTLNDLIGQILRQLLLYVYPVAEAWPVGNNYSCQLEAEAIAGASDAI